MAKSSKTMKPNFLKQVTDKTVNNIFEYKFYILNGTKLVFTYKAEHRYEIARLCFSRASNMMFRKGIITLWQLCHTLFDTGLANVKTTDLWVSERIILECLEPHLWKNSSFGAPYLVVVFR